MHGKVMTFFMKLGINFFPVYRRMGGRVTYISRDLREVHIKIPLNIFTRNYVRTIYGGCMFGAADGIHMLMFLKLLGPDYIVWDKAASIQFKKPGTETLYGKFIVSQDSVDEIKTVF